MKKIKLKCECSYCKNVFETDIWKVMFYRRITCPKCENYHAIVELNNRHGTWPAYLAALLGILATIMMERGTVAFYATFAIVMLVSYFILRYLCYATGYFKVYLTKWYR